MLAPFVLCVAWSVVCPVPSAKGTSLYTLDGHHARIRGAAFSPDGSELVTTADDRIVHVWQVSDGMCGARAFSIGHGVGVHVSQCPVLDCPQSKIDQTKGTHTTPTMCMCLQSECRHHEPILGPNYHPRWEVAVLMLKLA